jgi:chromosome segregation ATPase
MNTTNTNTPRILTLLTAIIMGYGAVSSCQSSEQKVQNAKEKVNHANQDLKHIQNDIYLTEQKTANADAWILLKHDWEAKITHNEMVIVELKRRLQQPDKKYDAAYESSIKDLEQKNKNVKLRIAAYDHNQSDWETFKREFSYDMEDLGSALNDLTMNRR